MVPKYKCLFCPRTCPTPHNSQCLTNGCAEARGGAKRNREREAGPGGVQTGFLVPGMSHMGHRGGTACPSAPLVLRLHPLFSLQAD